MCMAWSNATLFCHSDTDYPASKLFDLDQTTMYTVIWCPQKYFSAFKLFMDGTVQLVWSKEHIFVNFLTFSRPSSGLCVHPCHVHVRLYTC